MLLDWYDFYFLRRWQCKIRIHSTAVERWKSMLIYVVYAYLKFMLTCSRRLAKKVTRNDFLSTVVKNYHQGLVSKEEMAAHVSTLT